MTRRPDLPARGKKQSSDGKTTKSYQALRCRKGVGRTGSIELIGEEPLLIRIDDRPYAVVMRTPGEEVAHAAGYCLGEGIADSPDDFLTIGYCKDLDPNVIDVRLKPERREKIRVLLERRGFVSQTSCGICGKEMFKDFQQVLTPAENGLEVDIDCIFDCVSKLSESQNYYQTTRGSHASLLFDDKLNVISFAEDVGRHNALDKAIGKAFLAGELSRARILVLSSRVSYEMVQKAARAHVPMVISDSRPTALAVEMAGALNMTLAFPSEESDLVIVCGGHRIAFKR
jgi:FdhD protein